EGFHQSLKEKEAKAESFLYKEGNGIGYMEHHRGRTHPLKQWLKSLPRPVAIFAAHDPLGRVICEVCEECRLGVPEDVAVVGVNNDELLCNLSYPPLSSMMIPWKRIGTLAASLLEGLIQSGEHSGELFKVQPGDVIARQSSDFTAV